MSGSSDCTTRQYSASECGNVERLGAVAHIPCSSSIKKSEAAKKQRNLKKFGKQIQQEKLKQREMDKKSFNEKMHGIKRSE